MDITIRNECPKDYRKVEEITREAFWNLYVPGCSEHWIVHKIRTHPDYLPKLSFILEADGEIAGSIFYTKSKIVTEDQGEIETITFGPVSIVPSMHRKGLGRRLIEHSIEEAKKRGYRAILILGYPYHYEPYGFIGGKEFGISMADGKFYKGLQALPLYHGALDGISGFARFSDVFEEPDPDELEAFDKTFPEKEKAIQESQKEFEQAAAMIDE